MILFNDMMSILATSSSVSAEPIVQFIPCTSIAYIFIVFRVVIIAFGAVKFIIFHLTTTIIWVFIEWTVAATFVFRVGVMETRLYVLSIVTPNEYNSENRILVTTERGEWIRYQHPPQKSQLLNLRNCATFDPSVFTISWTTNTHVNVAVC